MTHLRKIVAVSVLAVFFPSTVWGLGLQGSLSINQEAFFPGDHIRIDLTLENTGSAVAVDAYMGIVFPNQGPCLPGDQQILFLINGTTGARLGCLSTALQDAQANFTNVTIPANLPPTQITNLFSVNVPQAAVTFQERAFLDQWRAKGPGAGVTNLLTSPVPRTQCPVPVGPFKFFIGFVQRIPGGSDFVLLLLLTLLFALVCP